MCVSVSLYQIASLKKQVAQKEQGLLDKDKQVGDFFSWQKYPVEPFSKKDTFLCCM